MESKCSAQIYGAQYGVTILVSIGGTSIETWQEAGSSQCDKHMAGYSLFKLKTFVVVVVVFKVEL